MDGDNKNIIACLNCTIDPTLCPTSPQWKAMSNANNLVCPPNLNNPNVPLVMTGIVNGVPQCRAPEPAGTRNDNYSCPNPGEVMTGVINGVPQCVTPSTGTTCPAKTLFVIAINNPLVSGSASPRLTETRSFSVPETQSGAAPIPFNAEIVFSRAGGTKRNTFTGSAFCGNGQWYCSISYYYSAVNYSDSYSAGGSYINGPCVQPSNRSLDVLNSTY